MRKINSVFAVLLTALILTACGSGKDIENTPKALKNYDTYAYLPNKDTIMSREYNNNELQEVIVETVNANLQDEGYSVDTRQPDVLVYVHPMFDEKVDVNADPVYTNYSYYRPNFYIAPYYKPYMYENYFTIQRLSGDHISQVPYRERSIVIDFINRRTKKIIWRGTSDKEIGKRRIEREVRNYIDDIFRDFP